MPDVHGKPRIACFATQGSGSLDELRIATLLEHLSPTVLPFNRDSKLRSSAVLVDALREVRPELVVMEGTGLGGGMAVTRARATLGVPYVVSSGDAIAPFWGLRQRSLRAPGYAYERALLGTSSGFIGWSPYLVGRALTLGAPRAMTAANWAPVATGHRDKTRARLGIPPEVVVFGLVGSLAWSTNRSYSYGLELVRAVRRVERDDLRVLVVGDGTGIRHLQAAAGGDARVILTGRVPHEEVADYVSAMDVASLPQSVDGVGSFRYTTKLSEYLAASVPIVTGRVPLAYDLDDGWIWRLPGAAPWEERYVAALARLMAEIQLDEAATRRALVPSNLKIFDKELQQRRAASFIVELLADRSRP
jgi:glycosyltransferase involved in cell wall biosynthesis